MPRRQTLSCADCGSPMWEGKGTLPQGQARCRECRKRRLPGHGTLSAWRKGCRCQPCKTAKSEDHKRYLAMREVRTGEKFVNRNRNRTKYVKACERCSAEFSTQTRTTRFCSMSCAKSKRRELVHVGPAAPFTKLPNCHPVMRRQPKRKPRVWCAGNCAFCGDSFVVVDQLTARYCSAKCASGSSRLARGKFAIPTSARLAIYERDSWTCQLCLEPVDQDLYATDPFGNWAPSLDHIECQSWALIPDHSPSNLRLAHRWCNAVRGDGTYYSEADLRVSA